MRSSFQNSCQVFARCGLALFFFQCCGCAHLAVVRTKPARLPRTVVAEGPLESANRYLAAAEHEQPVPALSHNLLAAKISYEMLERQPKDESARSIYNFAVARVVQDVDRTDIQPWWYAAIVATDQGNYSLSSPKPIDAGLAAQLAAEHDLLVTVEEGVLAGGFGSAVWETLNDAGTALPRIMRVGLPDRYVTHGKPALLHAEVGFTGRAIAQRIRAAVQAPDSIPAGA